MITVTKTFLPPQEEYNKILKRAWDAGWVTNRGILVQELEQKLKTYLNVPQVLATTNGTLSLQIAIKALGLKGEIITTPFSYVATTSTIIWEGCKPVFVDIHPEYLTIDETKIEAAITPDTTAILATHIFGNPCEVEEIERIAKKHNLKVIYDAAHAFGVKYKGESIFNYGDISACSFHATKLFHTGEGGALFTRDKSLMEKLFYTHDFGHNGQEGFSGVGINAKMSEPQAAMGLTVLPYMEKILKDREQVISTYRNEIRNLQFLKIRPETDWNFSYFPVIFPSEADLLNAIKILKKEDIVPRRYFYPSLDTLPYIKRSADSISMDISSRILCLPLFTDFPDQDLKKVISIMNSL
ncbi:DegT/DnrJ/EryC1/StrS family aminotransferase [Aequorivita sp. H23M31]|uniref:DegT/DnrJ/EryC1/StrS family aminotransferase n=1 Tax=Aequorivita ciconiae TaxID=2494375 RepID=A0A410G2C1_9FLAO|nr:DegT/DnrJ/EryC1/StrS family aminotransferase [Aequorivita sp. H23M31]QAA81375.1 DegT/DnrJ/EryC1/StrS family aminotransferase [Aequorivita sp. H23M31]